MQTDVLITTAAGALITTAIVDIAVQRITAVSVIAGDNCTVMAFSDAGSASAQNTDRAKVKSFLEKKETNLTTLAAEVATWGYLTKVRLTSGSLGIVTAASTIPQTITFATQANLAVGAANRALGATASSGLTVTYVSSNTAVATIVSGAVHAVAAGTCNITASQAGDATYAAATPVVRPITITP